MPKELLDEINQVKVGEIVVDGLHQILPHIQSASQAELIMAYVAMLKVTIASLPNAQAEKDIAKFHFDQLWEHLKIDRQMLSSIGRYLH